MRRKLERGFWDWIAAGWPVLKQPLGFAASGVMGTGERS
jgi:hypothetical protein